MAFMIDQFLFVVSAFFAAKGLWLIYDPSSFFNLFLNSATVTALAKGPFAFSYLTTILAAYLLTLASVAFYATTFPSLHSKVKVARSILVGTIILSYLSISDLLAHNKYVFSSSTAFHTYFTAPIVLIAIWAALNVVGGEEEHNKVVRKTK